MYPRKMHHCRVRTVISGVDLLRNPKYNKGMAFTPEERDRLYLRGAHKPFVGHAVLSHPGRARQRAVQQPRMSQVQPVAQRQGAQTAPVSRISAALPRRILAMHGPSWLKQRPIAPARSAVFVITLPVLGCPQSVVACFVRRASPSSADVPVAPSPARDDQSRSAFDAAGEVQLPRRPAGATRSDLLILRHRRSTTARCCLWPPERESEMRRRCVRATPAQERNERLFYRVLVDFPEDLKPIIYRPTVGQACLKYGLLFRRPRGLFISMADRGRIYAMLKNWPERDVKLICLTDGERVLGLGDLGIQGMGIAVSKVQSYTAFGGLDPSATLPVCIDAGTDTESLLEDPFYIGLRHKRVRGDSYDELVDEFVSAAQRRFGQTVLFQFEDFGNENGRRLLNEYRGRAAVFNDDIQARHSVSCILSPIRRWCTPPVHVEVGFQTDVRVPRSMLPQGTASAMLAGLIASLPIIGGGLADQTYLFAGAGEAGCGMADLLATAISKEKKISLPVARQRIWLVDSKGLITRSRMNELADHKLPWAHEGPEACTTMLAAVKVIKPSCLIGARRSERSGASERSGGRVSGGSSRRCLLGACVYVLLLLQGCGGRSTRGAASRFSPRRRVRHPAPPRFCVVPLGLSSR